MLVLTPREVLGAAAKEPLILFRILKDQRRKLNTNWCARDLDSLGRDAAQRVRPGRLHSGASVD